MNKGDWFSEVFLRKLGIVWKSEMQWFWVRNLILHLPAGFVIGAVVGLMEHFLPLRGILWSISGGALVAVLLFKERNEKQSKIKTAFDVCFWLLGFVGVWVASALM